MVDALGTAAVTAMMLCYAFEERGPALSFGFSLSCLAAAGYALVLGSWPFVAVESVWAGVALRRGLRRLRTGR